MKKIIYMGYLVSPDNANKINGVSIAGNKMQYNVVKELAKYNDVEITCVTIMPYAPYPRDKKIFQKYEREQIFSNVVSHKVSFLNLPIIKQFWQVRSAYRIAKKVIKEMGADTLFCFNLFPQIGIPMRKLKKKFSNLDTVCLLADLPIDDNKLRKGFSRFLRAKMEKSTWKSMQACDRYVCLNKYAMEKYLPNKPYIVVDGGVDDETIGSAKYVPKVITKRNVVFGGALTEYNGILKLIEAMKLIKSKGVTLDIYGDGYLGKEVEKAAIENDNINYYGKIKNQEMLKKQKEAWLLINPRLTSDLISNVTFPSKTFEYMLSGTPVLTTKLNGYSSEYDGKLFYSLDTAKGLAKAIDDFANTSQSEIVKVTKSAFNFIVEKRSWRKQVEKIYSFIIDVTEKE